MKEVRCRIFETIRGGCVVREFGGEGIGTENKSEDHPIIALIKFLENLEPQEVYGIIQEASGGITVFYQKELPE